ncbi:uncharacterized protein LOC144904875 [Branchiostoma floridae x Branchiostoma belcheri]
MCSSTTPRNIETPHLLQTCGYGQRPLQPEKYCHIGFNEPNRKTLFIKFLDLNMSEVHTLKIIDGPVSQSVNSSAITRPIRVKNDAYSIVFRSAKATKHPIKGWRALVYTESTTDAEVKHCTSNPATVSCTPTP